MVQTSYRMLCRALVIFSITALHIANANIDLHQQLSDALPIDSDLRIGRLDNGLRYYIRKNKRPEKQAIINLVVNVGSLNEQEHEQGLAHFLEHLQYKGSENFRDEKEFENYFNSHGIQSSADKNAYTSFDETSYFFVIPTDNEELFAKTFLTLSDFGGRALLRDEAINVERTVVLDELQMRNSAQLRQWYVFLPVFMAGTDYPNRFPIGKANIITDATSATIRNFYETWYVPRNMTLVAIGDFDPETVQKLIVSSFGSLKDKPVATTAHLKTKPSPKYGSSVFFVDPENGNSSLQIFFDLGTFRPRTVNNLRSMTIKSLATTILNQRMTTLTYQPQAASKGFGAYVAHDFFPDLSCSIAVSSFKEGKALDATKELVDLVKQFADYGISEDELAWAKKSIISQNEFLIANANTLPHGFFQSRLGKHFTNNDHLNIASIPATATLENELLSTIAVDDVTAAAQALFDFNKSIYLFAFSPEAYTAAGGIENEELFLQTIANSVIKPTQPYKALAAGELTKITGTTSGEYTVADIAPIEAKKIVLGNGITIYYKQTTLSENGINIAGFAPGGFDSMQANPVPSRLACSAIAAMGIGGLKPYQWATILSDKPNLSVGTSIDLHGRIVAASSRKEDLLFCFNIIMATMLEPNADQELFGLFAQNTKEAIKEKQNIPMRLFQEKNSELNFGHTTLFHPLTEEMIAQTTLNDVIKVYQSAFTNVGEFTFTIIGNVSLEELMPIVDNTLGLLPASKGSIWQAIPVEVNFPAGTSRITFDRKSQKQTMVCVSFPFIMHVSLETERILELYKHVLQMRLTEALRFDTGKTYAQSAYSSNLNELFVDYDDASARLQFYCSCSNENIEATTDIILTVLRTIQAEGFTAEEIAQAKKISQNNVTQAFKNNNTWNDYILDRHLRANDLFESVDTLSQHIENTTPEKINAFAKAMINPDHYLAHSLISEGTEK